MVDGGAGSMSSSAQVAGSKVSIITPRNPAYVVIAAAVSRSLCSAAYRKAVRRLASSAVKHVYASRCRALSHTAMMSASRPAR